MGDVLTLIEQAEREFDHDVAAEGASALLEGRFTLEDFLSQLQQVKKLGSLGGILSLMPGVPKELKQAKAAIDDGQVVQVEAIIRSMTPARAGRARPHRRLAPGPHRPGERDHHPGGEPAAAPVQRGPAAHAVAGHARRHARWRRPGQDGPGPGRAHGQRRRRRPGAGRTGRRGPRRQPRRRRPRRRRVGRGARGCPRRARPARRVTRADAGRRRRKKVDGSPPRATAAAAGARHGPAPRVVPAGVSEVRPVRVSPPRRRRATIGGPCPSSPRPRDKGRQGINGGSKAPPHADGKEEAADLPGRGGRQPGRRVTAGSSRSSAPTPPGAVRRPSPTPSSRSTTTRPSSGCARGPSPPSGWRSSCAPRGPGTSSSPAPSERRRPGREPRRRRRHG